MLQAIALSVIALVPLMCQIHLIRIFALLVAQLSEYYKDKNNPTKTRKKQQLHNTKEEQRKYFVLVSDVVEYPLYITLLPSMYLLFSVIIIFIITASFLQSIVCVLVLTIINSVLEIHFAGDMEGLK